MTDEVKGQNAVLTAVVEITRAATGEVETYILTGTDKEEDEE